MKKKKKIRWNVLAAIDYVCQKTKGKQLKYTKTAKMQKALDRLCAYFGGITETQVIILCAIMNMVFSHLRIDGVSKYFSMSSLQYLQHNDEIEDLSIRGLIEVRVNAEGHSYSLDNAISASIMRNEEICFKTRIFDPVDFVTEIASIIEERRVYMSTKVEKCIFSEEKNKNQKFIKDIRAILDDELDRICFYDICHDYIDGYDSSMRTTFYDVYGPQAQTEIRLMLSGNHSLQKRGIVDFCIKGNVSDSTMTLTEKGKDIFLGENIGLYERKLDKNNVISPESITAKPLFYSEENQKQIDMLEHALKQENLLSIQNELQMRGMPIGICVLLYGLPGTGKTESVYQLAKATDRDIIHVDISKTKSCWFGESEKNIERIFNDYKKKCQKLAASEKKNVPILLFNEADAVFQRRTEIRGSATEKTENAIQNIILENMEKFEGILIATTNLAINFDAAFERRFLFKIKFDSPSVQAKTAIWQSKLDWLHLEQARHLAEKYEFSGGEIDNIARKVAMKEILTGVRIPMDELEELCDAEKINIAPVERHIGFVAS